MKESTAKARGVDSRLRRIEGRHNALVKELRRAFDHGELTPDGYCAIEGLRILEEAIRSGLRFRAVFFSETGAARADRLLSQLGAQVKTLLLPDQLFAGVVPSETPQGVAALVRWKEFSLEEVLARYQTGPLLVIAGVQDPGNLGTILRSAEAFAASGVLLLPGTASPWNPKALRASAGSAFRVPTLTANEAETLALLAQHNIPAIAAVARAGTPLEDAPLAAPCALLIGNEGAGLSDSLLAAAAHRITIPMPGNVESLNAAIAGSLLLYESARQRVKARPTP